MTDAGERTVQLTVVRQESTADAEPRCETYAVRCDEYATVLDLLDQVREEYDGSLAYRYACRIGKCGICTAVVDGKTALTCMRRVGAADAIKVEPPARQRIVRDLVTERR